MKETDLMIGDWVYLYTYDEDGKEKRYTGKVSAISEYDNLGLNGDCNFMYEVEHCDEEYFEPAMPIPLTPEILEKNGWVHDTEYHNWWHEGVEFVIFCNEDNPHCYYVNSISSIQLDYIHSLQHILRLCRLNELADNFQI